MIIDFDIDNEQKNFPNYNLGNISYAELQKEPSMPHSHAYSEVFIPLNNHGCLLVGTEILKMEKPNIYIISPGVIHTEMNINNRNELKYCCIDLPFSVSKEENNKLKVFIINAQNVYDELVAYIKSGVRLHQLKVAEENTLKLLNMYCIYELIKSIINSHGYLMDSNRKKHTDPLVEEIIFYIETNFNTQISIEDLAHKQNISHRALTKKFQKAIGISPKQFLLNVRIKQAKEHLLSTDYSISQICVLCGFDNFAYFTYYFKKATGLTPSEFRKKNMN